MRFSKSEKNKNRIVVRDFSRDERIEQHDFWKSYFKSLIPSFSVLVFSLHIFYLIFLLNAFKMEMFNLAMQICVFIYIICAGIHLAFFKNKVAEQQLIKELRDHILELNNSMREERRDIQEYFLLWIHQMKTPITSIQLIAESQPLSHNINKIRQNALYIENYANMALNYLKLNNETTDLFVTNIKLDDIVKENLRKYSILFIDHRIKLEYQSLDIPVITDPKWFGIMFEQILSNAVKYTKNGVISILFHEYENSLEIKDTGIGIKKSDIPKIFDRGYSGFNGKLQEKSTGIGLFLVRQISTRLNIEIEINSDLAVGTSFKLYFPKDIY